MPDPNKPDWRIVSISCRDSHTGVMRAFTLTTKRANKHQICCDTEKEVLEKWAEWVAKYDFDVLAGWYSSGFDWPYITHRAERIRANLDAMSRISTMHVTDRRIPGRTLADMLDLSRIGQSPLVSSPLMI